MIASRIVSFFFFALSFGIVAAAPALNVDIQPALDKRATSSDVEGVLNTLKKDTSTFSSSINNLVASGDATEATLTPIFNDLKTALDTAASSLNSIQGPVSTAAGPSVDEVGALAAGIVADVANAVGLVQNVAGVGGLIASIDFALNQVLLGLGVLLAGVLRVVSNLLTTVLFLVLGLLRGLGLTLVLGTLGL